jgi:hypothetical protein
LEGLKPQATKKTLVLSFQDIRAWHKFPDPHTLIFKLVLTTPFSSPIPLSLSRVVLESLPSLNQLNPVNIVISF